MSNSGRNEKRKLTATYINGVALTVLSAGAIGPVLAAASGADTMRVAGACIVGSIVLHLVARMILRRLG